MKANDAICGRSKTANDMVADRRLSCVLRIIMQSAAPGVGAYRSIGRRRRASCRAATILSARRWLRSSSRSQLKVFVTGAPELARFCPRLDRRPDGAGMDRLAAARAYSPADVDHRVPPGMGAAACTMASRSPQCAGRSVRADPGKIRWRALVGVEARGTIRPRRGHLDRGARTRSAGSSATCRREVAVRGHGRAEHREI